MRRRDFIAGLGGAAAMPLAVLAQQAEPIRRIAVLMPFDVDDPEGKVRFAAFHARLDELQKLRVSMDNIIAAKAV